MNSMADFKRRVKTCADNPTRTISISYSGRVRFGLTEVNNAPVTASHGHAFSIQRPNGQVGWINFGSAKNWTFERNVATHTGMMGGKTIITFNQIYTNSPK